MFDAEFGYEILEDEHGDFYITLPLEQFRNLLRLSWANGKQQALDRSSDLIRQMGLPEDK